MKEKNSSTVLACLTTMFQPIFPVLLERICIRSSISSFQFKKWYNCYIWKDISDRRDVHKRPSEAVAVLRTDRAKMDTKTLPILGELVCLGQCCCKCSFWKSDIWGDTMTHVLEREAIWRRFDMLWVNKDGTPHRSSPGVVIWCPSAD